jgi:hypothetical protein
MPASQFLNPSIPEFLNSSIYGPACEEGTSLIRVAVIDGQGGGIGTTVVKKIKEACGEQVEVWALGTNAIATSQMMKARANRGATGENAICHCVQQVDVIIGPVAILLSNAMMGEVTPAMVQAIGSARARKILIPLTQEPLVVVGTVREPLPHLVEKLVVEHLMPYVLAGADSQ